VEQPGDVLSTNHLHLAVEFKISGTKTLFPVIHILDLDGDVTFFNKKKSAKEALISGEILIALNGQSA
jgi:hypothetical protein